MQPIKMRNCCTVPSFLGRGPVGYPEYIIQKSYRDINMPRVHSDSSSGARTQKDSSLYKSILERTRNFFAFDKKFNMRSEEELQSIARNLYSDMLFQKDQERILHQERQAKRMAVSLRRLKQREFASTEVSVTIDESKFRYRSRVKQDEYELSRLQLKIAKEKHKFLKKAHKLKRRADLLAIHNPDSFDSDFSNVEYNSLADMGYIFDVASFDVLFNTIKNMGSIIDIDVHTPIMVSIINLIVVFSRSKDSILRASATATVISTFKLDFSTKAIATLAAGVASYVGSVFADEKSELQYQSLEDVAGIASTLDKVLNADFVNAVRQLFVGLTTYLAFPREHAAKVFDLIGTTAIKMSGLRLVKTVLEIIVKIGRSASLWWHGQDGKAVPLSEILFGASTIESLKAEYAILELYQNQVYSGLPVDKHMCQYHYMRLSKAFIAVADAYGNSIGRHNPDYRRIQDWVINVTRWSNLVGNRIQTQTRIPAFSTLVVGEPGVGKSLTVQLLASRPAAIKGYKFEMSHIYPKNADDDFWEGYAPREHNVVFMSEVGKKARNLAQTQGDKALDAFLSAGDSIPYFLNMAFEGKGKTPFLAELFLIDANNETLNLDVLYSNPSAFWRRILIIDQIVKPQYRKMGSCQVDPDKCEDMDCLFDAYLYTVSVRTPETSVKSNKIPIVTNVDYIKMVEIFDTMFIQHQMRNSRVNSQLLDLIRSIPCTSEIVSNVPRTYFNEPVEDDEKKLTNGIFGAARAEDYGLPASVRFGNKVRSMQDQLNNLYSYVSKDGISVKSTLRVRTIENLFGGDPQLKIENNGVFDTDSYVNQTICKAEMPTTDVGRLCVSTIEKPIAGTGRLYRAFNNIMMELISRYDQTTVLELDEKSDHSFSASYFEKVHMLQDFLSQCSGAIVDPVSAITVLENTVFCLQHIMDSQPPKIEHSMYQALREIEMTVDGGMHFFESKCPSVEVAEVLEKRKVDSDEKVQYQMVGIVGDARTHAQFYWDTMIECFNSSIAYCFYFSVGKCIPEVIDKKDIYHFIPTLVLWLIGLCPTILLYLYIIILAIFFSFPKIAAWYVRRRVVSKARFYKARAYDTVQAIGNRLGYKVSPEDPEILLCIRNVKYGMFVSCALLSSIVVFEKIRKIFKKTIRVEHNAAFSKHAFGEYEEKSGCDEPYARIKPAHDPWNWNVISNLHPRYPHTGGLKTFRDFIRKNTMFVRIKIANKEYNSHCIGLSGHVVLINTHFHKNARDQLVGPLVIEAGPLGEDGPMTHTVSAVKGSYIDLGNDITIAMCSRKFGNVLQHVSVRPISFGEGSIEDVDVQVNFFNENPVKINDQIHNEYYLYRGYAGLGKCGNVLTASVGSSWVIIGVHAIGEMNGDMGYSMPLYRGALEKAVQQLHQNLKLMQLSDMPENNRIFNSLPVMRVNSKSPFKHIHLPNVDYYGTVTQSAVNRKSSVVSNIYAPFIKEIEMVTGMKQEKIFTAPVMKAGMTKNGYVSPQNNALSHFTGHVEMNEFPAVTRAVSYLTPKLLSRLKEEVGDIKLHPYLAQSAINGSPVDAYLRRINASTAAGFGLKGKKKDFLPLEDDEITRNVDDVVAERILDIFKSFDKRELSGTIFNVALKDEPVTVKKATEGVTRLFYVHELAHLIVSRQFLGPIVTLIQQTEAFCSMVGINMYQDAEAVYSKLVRFPNYVENDAKKFDITAAFAARWGTFTIVHNICEALGYNEQAMIYLDGVLSDLLNPMYVLDGDLFSKSSVPSGHYGTAELNCLIVLILMVISFQEAQDEGKIPKSADFFDHVSPAYYGDDQSASVSDIAAPGVNGIALSDIYTRFSMTLTASDKCS